MHAHQLERIWNTAWLRLENAYFRLVEWMANPDAPEAEPKKGRAHSLKPETLTRIATAQEMEVMVKMHVRVARVIDGDAEGELLSDETVKTPGRMRAVLSSMRVAFRKTGKPQNTALLQAGRPKIGS